MGFVNRVKENLSFYCGFESLLDSSGSVGLLSSVLGSFLAGRYKVSKTKAVFKAKARLCKTSCKDPWLGKSTTHKRKKAWSRGKTGSQNPRHRLPSSKGGCLCTGMKSLPPRLYRGQICGITSSITGGEGRGKPLHSTHRLPPGNPR